MTVPSPTAEVRELVEKNQWSRNACVVRRTLELQINDVDKY